jgi:hypothetical protein
VKPSAISAARKTCDCDEGHADHDRCSYSFRDSKTGDVKNPAIVAAFEAAKKEHRGFTDAVSLREIRAERSTAGSAKAGTGR